MGRAVNEFLFGTKRRQGVVQAAGSRLRARSPTGIVRGLLGSILEVAGRRMQCRSTLPHAPPTDNAEPWVAGVHRPRRAPR